MSNFGEPARAVDARADMLKVDAIIDDALRTAPLRPTPQFLLAHVMARVALTPRFRLEWLDYALTLFMTGVLGGALAVGWLVTPSLTIETGRKILYEAQFAGASGLLLITLSATAFALGMLLVAAFVFARGRATVVRI